MYTPRFSDKAAITVRRLAWALDMPMTKAIERIIDVLPFVFSPGLICLDCRDKSKCANCAFCDQTAGGKAKPAA
jgi:hypothetical protein